MVCIYRLHFIDILTLLHIYVQKWSDIHQNVQKHLCVAKSLILTIQIMLWYN